MMLKNLMEEKQLDLNQPLLSVRRFSSTAASETDNKRKTNNSLARLPPLPAYKSELKSGPVSNPGTIPFIWERTPGTPKDESKFHTLGAEQPAITPNLPPGRVLKVKQPDYDKVSKGVSFTQSRTGITISNSPYVTSLDKKVTKHESSKEGMQEKASSASDDGGEAYQDALDTLSRTESFFMNCSVSGLSGLDDQEFQPSGSFSADQQARNFMIGRFLPAAWAIASETPQYASRKPPVAREQPRQVKEVVSEQRYNSHRQNVLSHYAQNIGREESEDEGYDYNGSENYATKLCGLFPRLCLLNPMPELKMENKVLSSADHGMQAKSSAHGGTEKEHARTAYNEKKSVDSWSGFREERHFLCVPEKFKRSIDPQRRGNSKLSACESTESESGSASPVVEKKLYVDSVHKGQSHSSSYSSEMKGQTNHRRVDFETLTKDIGFYKKPAIESSLEDSKCSSIVDEKATLQPKSSESLNLSLLSCSDRFSNDTQMDITNHSTKIDIEKLMLMKPVNQGSDLDQDLAISSPKVVQCKKMLSENQVTGIQENSDGPIHNNVSWRILKFAGDVVDSKSVLATKSIDEECTHGLTQEPSKLASSKVVGDGKINMESQWLMRSGNKENSDAIYLELPLALPLPKAPSESWLKRTLPTISSRNISSLSYAAAQIHGRSQTPKTASLDPKWETLVKSSNIHNGHLRLSEELLTPIPED